MRLRDMKYIGFKHQRENKQNSDNDDDICFVLDQHVELDFYSASSLKQQSVPIGHIILILSRSVFALTP
jgi:hypothetical protein